ncbi:MAG: hypothetical protein QMC55_04080 [Amylibacter sp.]
MNLKTGNIVEGSFQGENIKLEGIKNNNGPITLGFRAEDAEIVNSGGQIIAPVYTMELLGDATMITVLINGELVSVKVSKDYRAAIGDIVHISVPIEICHLFDAHSGARIGD